MPTDINSRPRLIIPPMTSQRSQGSIEDVWDSKVGPQSGLGNISNGMFRPRWRVREIATTSDKVRSVTPGVQSLSAGPAFQPGMFDSPVAPPSGFNVIPNLSTAIQCKGVIHVTFQVTVTTSAPNDPVVFAVFRDGQQISKSYTASHPTSNQPFSIVQTITDNPSRTNHVYDVRWQAGASTLTAIGVARSLYALDTANT